MSQLHFKSYKFYFLLYLSFYLTQILHVKLSFTNCSILMILHFLCLKYDDVRHFLISCKKYKESRLKLQNTLNYTNNQMTLKTILKV